LNQKSAIITGLRGQDGSILARKLLEQDYKVYGLVRRSSTGKDDLNNACDLINNKNLEVVEGDLLDLPSLTNLCKLAKADIMFNMAAMSHVHMSFKLPVYTLQVNTIGVLNCLEAIRSSGIYTKFLTANTSEQFGGISTETYNEDSKFYARSPYGVSKIAAFELVRNYREAYKMFACSSICFNHESEYRSADFVTRKITLAVAKIKAGIQNKLYLGNINSYRDWSYAGDMCDGMILMLTKSIEPKDYVLASGETHSIKEFLEVAFEYARLGSYAKYVEIDPNFYRPTEVEHLIGDSSKIRNELGWSPKVSFESLVKLMVDNDEKILNWSNLCI